MRAHPVRKEYVKKVDSAVVIQRHERKHVRHQRAREWRTKDPMHQAAIALVKQMLKEPEGPKSAGKVARGFFSLDIVDEFDLGIPHEKYVTRGIHEYLYLARLRAPRIIIKEIVPLWATQTTHTGSHAETNVETEVLFPGDKPVRIEYTVRHGRRSNDDRICRRRTTNIHLPQTEDAAEGDEVTTLSPRKALRQSFAKLDADGSGHLSISEIVSASSLLGLSFNAGELQKQLLSEDNDGDGTFELHELDDMLKKDEQLERTGIERFDRPVIFEMLPLIARSFDAHSTVEDVMHKAAERERAMAEEDRQTRIATTRGLARSWISSPDMLAVKTTARLARLRTRAFRQYR